MTTIEEHIVHPFRRLINLIEAASVSESLSDWVSSPDDAVWVHYSKEDHLSINPKPLHQDPVGLYFFPETFKPIGQWTNLPYKFTAKLKPGTKVLDLSKISQLQLNDLLDRAGCREKNDAKAAQYPPKSMINAVDRAWETMVAHYAYEWRGSRSGGAFNKLFRDAGYQAIFDDTKSIHSSEVQLLVLDPRSIKVVSLEKLKGNNFQKFLAALRDVEDVCKPYGIVTSDLPRLKAVGWNGDKFLRSYVTLQKSNNQYIKIVLTKSSEDIDVTIGDVRYKDREIIEMIYRFRAFYELRYERWSEYSGLDKLETILQKL